MSGNSHGDRKTWVTPVLDQLSVASTATGPTFLPVEAILVPSGAPAGPESS